jgi:hypothetical protein
VKRTGKSRSREEIRDGDNMCRTDAILNVLRRAYSFENSSDGGEAEWKGRRVM